MDRHWTPCDLDGVLKACDPVAPSKRASDGIAGVLDELGPAITSRPRRATRARRRWTAGPRRLLLAGAVIALIAGGGAAATELLTAHTGQYATGWQVKAGGPGEDLRTWAPDFCRVALKLGADIPYPSGYAGWRNWVLVSELGLKHVTVNGPCGPGTRGHSSTAGAVRGFFAMSAFCAWVYDWRAAKLARNRAEAANAVSTIAAAPRWPAVVAEDPHPNPRNPGSTFGWFLPFRSAVLNGDITVVNHLVATNYGTAGCPYFVPPATSHGGTVLPPLPRS